MNSVPTEERDISEVSVGGGILDLNKADLAVAGTIFEDKYRYPITHSFYCSLY